MNGEEEGDEPSFEYVPESLDIKDPALEAFSNVFARFQLPPDETPVCLAYMLHGPL